MQDCIYTCSVAVFIIIKTFITFFVHNLLSVVTELSWLSLKRNIYCITLQSRKINNPKINNLTNKYYN